jgi:hypothetical protein
MTDITFEDEFFGFLDGAAHEQKRLADRAMVQFVVLRLSLVVASASLPALITMAGKEWSSGVAVLVAALTGLDTQFRWGEEWRHFRSTQLALERMKRDYNHRKAALNGGRSIGSITTEAENFDKLYSNVEELLQIEADSFFKFRITEWRQPQGRPA